MKKKRPRNKRLFALINAVLLLVSTLCAACIINVSNMLTSQQAAKRWKGESDKSFAQISCFIPADQTVTASEINLFRQVMVSRFKEAAIESPSDRQLFNDAWSTSGKVNVSSSLGSNDVSVYAVGGDFFFFHPLKLKSGNYIGADDLMQDRVLLDEDTAWLLFGSDDIHGQSFRINGEYFVVAGVVEREDDFATKKAYTEGMGIFMSYDAYLKLDETAGIQCYEVVMPEPVKGFAYSIASEKFPIGRGEILNNTTRFDFFRLAKLIGQYGERSMQNKGIIYPYWENAARYAEDIAALLIAVCVITALMPVTYMIILIVKLLAAGKRKLKEEVIPHFKETTGEKIRKRQYERWQKKHPSKH